MSPIQDSMCGSRGVGRGFVPIVLGQQRRLMPSRRRLLARQTPSVSQQPSSSDSGSVRPETPSAIETTTSPGSTETASASTTTASGSTSGSTSTEADISSPVSTSEIQKTFTAAPSSSSEPQPAPTSSSAERNDEGPISSAAVNTESEWWTPETATEHQESSPTSSGSPTPYQSPPPTTLIGQESSSHFVHDTSSHEVNTPSGKGENVFGAAPTTTRAVTDEPSVWYSKEAVVTASDSQLGDVKTVTFTGQLVDPTNVQASMKASTTKLSTGAIVGIAVAGSVGLLIILAFLLRCCLKRRSKRAHDESDFSPFSGRSSDNMHDMDFSDKPPIAPVASTLVNPLPHHMYDNDLAQQRSISYNQHGAYSGFHTRYSPSDDLHLVETPTSNGVHYAGPESSGVLQAQDEYTTDSHFTTGPTLSSDRLTALSSPGGIRSTDDVRLSHNGATQFMANPTSHSWSRRAREANERYDHSRTEGFRTPQTNTSGEQSPATSALNLASRQPPPPFPAELGQALSKIEADLKRTMVPKQQSTPTLTVRNPSLASPVSQTASTVESIVLVTPTSAANNPLSGSPNPKPHSPPDPAWGQQRYRVVPESAKPASTWDVLSKQPRHYGYNDI